MPERLSELLARHRDAEPAWRDLYDEFVGMLRAIDVGTAAPAVGDVFPPFSLPDAGGHFRSLDGLLAEGPLVLSFNRGGWCPYCSHELRSWSRHMPALRAAGAGLAVITPEVGGRAALLARLVGGDAQLLCDVDHGVALASGLAFFIGEPLQRRYQDWGLDVADIYGSSSGFLPVPATFVLDRGGVVRFAHVDPDFRMRAEPGDVLQVIASLRG